VFKKQIVPERRRGSAAHALGLAGLLLLAGM
jgi:hypothetical protein